MNGRTTEEEWICLPPFLHALLSEGIIDRWHRLLFFLQNHSPRDPREWNNFIMGIPQYDRNFGGYRVFCGDLGQYETLEPVPIDRPFLSFLVGSRTNKFELEKEFDTFGPLVDCWVARNPPGFAFVVFKRSEDAERAVDELDGR